MKRKYNKTREVIILDGTKALIHSANKLNRSMPEVARGCGAIGDKKYNRKKEKRAVQRDLRNDPGSSFYLHYSLVKASAVGW